MKKLKSYVVNSRLHTKLLMIMIPSSIISSMVIMIVSFFVFRQYEEKLYQSTIQSLNMSVADIEAGLMTIESDAERLMMDSALQTAFQFKKPNIRQKEVSSEYHSLAVDFYQLLKNEYDSNSAILSISVFVDDEWYYIGNLPKKIDEKLINTMKDKLSYNSKSAFWFPDSYPGNRMYYVRNIREISGSFRILGQIMIECDFQALIQSKIKNNKNLNYKPNIHIYDEEGLIYTDMVMGDQIENKMNGKPYDIISIDHETYFASFTEASVYSWHCITLLPFNNIFGSVSRLKMAFILVDLGVVIIAVLFCRYLISFLTRHFDNLVVKMQYVQNGNFHFEKSPSYKGRNDEIGYIHQSFDDMAMELEKLIQDNYIKQLLIQENKLKMLQQQINPHFLFNTLQTINWKTKDNKPAEASLMVEALGKLLRYTLQGDEDPVPLSEELKIVRCYVDIQKIRYQDRLNVLYQVPEHLYLQRIPKLSLQNVVENSIKYALEAMLEPCTIKIWAREEERAFHLYVEDNGPGIDETALEKVSEPEDNKKIYGLGIGLANISQRIKLLFSDEYKLILHNTGHGTIIEFYLPKLEWGLTK